MNLTVLILIPSPSLLSLCPILYTVVKCPQLMDPEHGTVVLPEAVSFKSVAKYTCDNGYMLNGTAERTCQANQQWSGSERTCESEILDKLAITNAMNPVHSMISHFTSVYNSHSCRSVLWSASCPQ